MPDSTSRFIDFWRVGYRRLIPITIPDCEVSPRSTLAGRPKDIGKAPGIRGHDGLWRSFHWMAHETSESDLSRWGVMGCGVGLRTGGGLVALDIDSLDKAIVAKVVQTASTMLGTAPWRIGNYPKTLMLYACAEDVPYQRVEFTDALADPKKPPRVELLQEGRQFVAAGIHPVTGKPYAWYGSDGQPLVEMPAPAELVTVIGQQIDAFFARLAEILPAATKPAKASLQADAERDQSSLQADPQLVGEAVRALPNTTQLYGTYDDYIRVGAAIKGALGGQGEDLFVEWAMRWPDAGEEHNPERIAGDFRRIKPPYRLGANWLFDQAAKHGSFNAAREWFSPIETGPEDLFAAAKRAPNPARFQTETLLEAAAKARSTSTQPLVKGLLDQGAASCVYGDSNVGKSLVVMDLVWHVAAGKPWGGLRTAQKAVLYIAAEGGGGIRKRAEALRRKYGVSSADADLHILPKAIDLLHPDVDLGDLMAWLREHPSVGLVIVDTASRALAGGDENSSVDMGAFVKNFDALRAATGAHVLIIHHTGKDKARGMRGWSGMRAAIDTEIEIEEGRVAVTKQRDMDKTWVTGFAIDGLALWNDADGDSVTSATVRLMSEAASAALLAHKAGGTKTGLREGAWAALEHDAELNTLSQIVERMADRGQLDGTTRKHTKSVDQALAGLMEGGYVVRNGRPRMYRYARVQGKDLYFDCMAPENGDSEKAHGQPARTAFKPSVRAEGVIGTNGTDTIFH